MSEVLSAIPLVQAFAREKYEEERFDAVTAETVRESIRVARLEAAATRSSEIITAVGTAAAVSFGATIREKIAYGRAEATAEEINAAAKAHTGREVSSQLGE